MGYEFEIIAADIDEKAIRHDDPSQMVLAIANAKADALVPRLGTEGLLITADLAVVFEGEVLEKPRSEEEAFTTLRGYQGKPVGGVTAVVVTNLQTGKRASGIDKATVFFKRPFGESTIRDFIKSGKTFEHAGGLGVERPEFAPFVDHIEGTLDSVMGLPKDLTKKLIAEVQ